MAFNVADRVRVTSQASGFRDRYGVVVSVVGDAVRVRIDGQPGGSSALFSAADLRESTQPVTIDY